MKKRIECIDCIDNGNSNTCIDCDDCVYIGEGDFICMAGDLPVLVLEDFTDPTEYFCFCNEIAR
jgi:hypothetical protein